MPIVIPPKKTTSKIVVPQKKSTAGTTTKSGIVIPPKGSSSPALATAKKQVVTMSGSLPNASPYLPKGQFYQDKTNLSNRIETDRDVPISLKTKLRGENQDGIISGSGYFGGGCFYEQTGSERQIRNGGVVGWQNSAPARSVSVSIPLL